VSSGGTEGKFSIGPETESQLVALRHLDGIAIQQASAEPGTREPPVREKEPAGRREQTGPRRVPWQLMGVLVVQAALSLRLTWSNTAFEDEALYLWVGHMEWAHWLHGAQVQPFQAWFSGAPVLYPPIAAVADAIGGLAAARLLSLAFMIGVTCFLWGTARRLVGNRAALVAVTVFATLAGTAFLGAFATYDALALLLLTGATWTAVRACHRSARATRLGTLRLAAACLFAGVLLGVACAVKYASALFVPLVVVVVVLAAWREPAPRWSGRSRAVVALLSASIGIAATLAAGLTFGGHSYWEGVMVTTLDRQSATSSPFTVLKLSYLWTGFILVMSPLAILASRKERAVDRWLLGILALAILLVPLEQARVDTTVSLHKHVVFGAWFASMAAGYLFAQLSSIDKTKGWAAVVAIPIVAFTVLESIPQATTLFSAWTDVAPITAVLPRLTTRYPGNYLTSTDLYQVLGYYDQGRAGWSQWQSDLYLTAAGAPPGLASDRIAIRDHYFSLVFINTRPTSLTNTDEAVIAYLRQVGGYSVVADTGGIEVWTSVEDS
jgi:4-amino-4-deoxy-L-arabinose transferase-like glycosyltransferase